MNKQELLTIIIDFYQVKVDIIVEQLKNENLNRNQQYMLHCEMKKYDNIINNLYMKLLL